MELQPAVPPLPLQLVTQLFGLPNSSIAPWGFNCVFNGEIRFLLCGAWSPSSDLSMLLLRDQIIQCGLVEEM